MKKLTVFLIVFCGWQAALYSQVVAKVIPGYISSTNDITLGNRPLMHNNELRIGLGTDATSRAQNLIRIGDGSFIQIGEWEANDLLSFKAGKYNFTNGNVGIGTTSPTALLDVNGTLKANSLSVTGELKANSLIAINGQLTSGTNNLALQTNGTTRMTVLNTNGYVGIGTTAPSAQLDVNGVTKTTSLTVINGQLTSGANNLVLQTNGTTRMTVLNTNGYVGIGTTSPTVPLEVNGSMKANTLSLVSGLTSYSTNPLYLQVNGSNKMTILNSGYVGIGTTTPSALLDVNGTVKMTSLSIGSVLSSSGTNNLALQTNGTTRMTVLNSNGYVGIGTTTPSALLDVNGTTKTTSLSVTNGQLTSGANNLALQTNGTTRMTILYSNGNVGIGTASPTVPLEVNGSMKANTLSLVSGLTSYSTNPLYLQVNGSSKMTILNSGYVGIGTTSPTVALDINGAVKASSLILTGDFTVNKLITSDNLQIGSANASMNAYGKKLLFGSMGDNMDEMWIARFNVSADKSELRVNVGDDFNDKFIVGRREASGDMDFTKMFTVVTNGNVGVGTDSPDYKVDVVGKIRAHEVLINTQKTADFVFSEDYELRSLQEVEQYIVNHKHLPEIPSDSEVKENGGVNLGDMQIKLLQKVEELTLYLIRQDNTIQELKAEIKELKNK